MRKHAGFTLIELMIVVVIIAIIAAIGFPSYREHVARGQRSEGQQLLAETAQRQEQFLLDRRQYGGSFAALNVNIPTSVKYNTTAGAPNSLWTVDNTATPPTYTICIPPAAGSNLANRNDGRLCINSRGERWREVLSGNGTFEDNPGTECAWVNSSCRISGEG